MQVFGVDSALELFWSEASPNSLITDFIEGGHQLNNVRRAQCVPCCVLAKYIEEEKCASANHYMTLCWVDMKPVSYVYCTFFLFAHITLKEESTCRIIIASYAAGYKPAYTSVFNWEFRVRGILHYGSAQCQLKFACPFSLGVDLQVVNKLNAIVIQWFSFMSLFEITYLATRRWDPGVVSMVLMLVTPRTVSTQGLIQFVHESRTCVLPLHVVILGNLRMLDIFFSHPKWCSTQIKWKSSLTMQKIQHELFIFSQMLPTSDTTIKAIEIAAQYYHHVQADITFQMKFSVHHTREQATPWYFLDCEMSSFNGAPVSAHSLNFELWHTYIYVRLWDPGIIHEDRKSVV